MFSAAQILYSHGTVTYAALLQLRREKFSKPLIVYKRCFVAQHSQSNKFPPLIPPNLDCVIK